jgi:signal transduction histidine kinase
MAEVVVLARDLAAARTADEAVHTAVDFCARGLGLRTAVWLGDEPGRQARDREREWIIPAGSATIFVADAKPAYRCLLEAMGALLAETLENLDDRERATRQTDDLDLGLAVTAHELRGPLLGARAALEQLAHDDAEPTPENGLLRRTAFELDALSRKVDGLLRWSVGADRPERESCDLVQITREAIGTCTLQLREERVVLFAPDRVLVDAAPTHLRMAIENLVRNALAFSPPDSKVEVDLRVDGTSPTVSVRDEGPGVPPEERDCMFDAFARGACARGRSGHGLGLFIAKRIVDAHGGELTYDPPESGDGSVFRITLPHADP